MFRHLRPVCRHLGVGGRALGHYPPCSLDGAGEGLHAVDDGHERLVVHHAAEDGQVCGTGADDDDLGALGGGGGAGDVREDAQPPAMKAAKATSHDTLTIRNAAELRVMVKPGARGCARARRSDPRQRALGPAVWPVPPRRPVRGPHRRAAEVRFAE
jgi:hypothetical protein